MPDENTTPAPDQTMPPAAPAPQPGATFTQSDLDRAVAEASRKAHDAAWAEARRREAASRQRPAAPSDPAPAQPAPQPATSIAPEYQAMRAFDRAMRRFDLSDDALAVIEEDFARANPSDPVAWVTSRASAYGWKQLGGTPPPAAPAVGAPPAPPAVPAPPMPGSTPPAALTATADTPIMSLLRADASRVDAMSRDMGAQKFRDRLMQEFRATGQRVRIR